MKNTLLVLLVMLALGACNKDDFESTPKIEFVEIKPNLLTADVLGSNSAGAPKLIFNVTDAEGDLGTGQPDDSSWIYLKNLQTGELDSVRFPDLSRAPKNDFKGEVSVNLFDYLVCLSSPAPPASIDTTYFEVYVRDAKNHKSNTFTTPPTMQECP